MDRQTREVVRRLALFGRRVIHNSQIAACQITKGAETDGEMMDLMEMNLAETVLEAEALLKMKPDTKNYPILFGTKTLK